MPQRLMLETVLFRREKNKFPRASFPKQRNICKRKMDGTTNAREARPLARSDEKFFKKDTRLHVNPWRPEDLICIKIFVCYNRFTFSLIHMQKKFFIPLVVAFVVGIVPSKKLVFFL